MCVGAGHWGSTWDMALHPALHEPGLGVPAPPVGHPSWLGPLPWGPWGGHRVPQPSGHGMGDMVGVPAVLSQLWGAVRWVLVMQVLLVRWPGLGGISSATAGQLCPHRGLDACARLRLRSDVPAE